MGLLRKDVFPRFDEFFMLKKSVLGLGGPWFLPVREFNLGEEIFNII